MTIPTTIATSISAVLAVMDLFTAEKAIAPLIQATGSITYTVTANKTFYLVGVLLFGNNSILQYQVPGGSLTTLCSLAGGSNQTVSISCQTMPLTKGSNLTYNNISPANSALIGMPTGSFSVPSPQLYIFPAGTVISITPTSSTASLFGFEI